VNSLAPASIPALNGFGDLRTRDQGSHIFRLVLVRFTRRCAGEALVRGAGFLLYRAFA